VKSVYWFYYDTSDRLWLVVRGTAEYNESTDELSNQSLYSAYEYRYDGGRQRYLTRPRDPNNGFAISGDGQWRDYSGNDIHRDYTVNPATGGITDGQSYLAGVGFDDAGTDSPHYLGADQIGTTRRICDSDTSNPAITRRIFTAFGEPVDTNGNGSAATRYGYAGAYGYEEAESGDPLSQLGWLHVGERYYAPELGRFVQRDPIGIRGGFNTYAYVNGNPATRLDPSGLQWRAGPGNFGVTPEQMSEEYIKAMNRLHPPPVQPASVPPAPPGPSGNQIMSRSYNALGKVHLLAGVGPMLEGMIVAEFVCAPFLWTFELIGLTPPDAYDFGDISRSVCGGIRDSFNQP